VRRRSLLRAPRAQSGGYCLPPLVTSFQPCLATAQWARITARVLFSTVPVHLFQDIWSTSGRWLVLRRPAPPGGGHHPPFSAPKTLASASWTTWETEQQLVLKTEKIREEWQQQSAELRLDCLTCAVPERLVCEQPCDLNVHWRGLCDHWRGSTCTACEFITSGYFSAPQLCR